LDLSKVGGDRAAVKVRIVAAPATNYFGHNPDEVFPVIAEHDPAFTDG